MAFVLVLLLFLVRLYTSSSSGGHHDVSIQPTRLSASSYSPLSVTNTTKTPTTDLPSASTSFRTSTNVSDWTSLLFSDRKSRVTRFIPALNASCLKLLQTYATLASEFVYCSLAYSKPLLLCETCIIKYKNLNTAYRKIENDKACGDSLLYSDRIQVLMESHSFVEKMWKKASCKKCFKDFDTCDVKNGCPVTDEVAKFLRYNSETINCFQQTGELNENVCRNCSGHYRQLNSLYNQMGSVEDICFDCVEQMNSTRKEWSEVFNCTHTRKDIVSIVAISTFFCSLPLFFYIGVKVHTVKSEYKLMAQSRLKKPHRTTVPRLPRLPRLPQHGEAFLTEDSTSNTNN